MLKASSAEAVPEALLSGISTDYIHHVLVYISICQTNSTHSFCSVQGKQLPSATPFFLHLSSTQLTFSARPHKCIELTAEKVGSLV